MFLLKEAMSLLAQTGTLPSKCKPHKLTGNYKDCWECHLRPDWLNAICALTGCWCGNKTTKS